LTPDELSKVRQLNVSFDEDDGDGTTSVGTKGNDSDAFQLMNFEEHNWNDIYQRLVSLPMDSPQMIVKKDLQICEVIGKFNEAAQATVKHLLDSYHQLTETSNSLEAGTCHVGNLELRLVTNSGINNLLNLN
jgi:hypothetical protein